MPAATLYFGDDARSGLIAGARLAARLVAATIGPKGRSVLIERPHHMPMLVRDGYSVLQHLDAESGPAQMAIQALRELAWRTNDAVGDGTSTAVVATVAMLETAFPALVAGQHGMAIKLELERQFRRLGDALVGRVESLRDHDQLEAVAVAAAGGDLSVGTRVAAALRDVGEEGVVLVAESPGLEDCTETLPGLHIDQGWLSPAFVTDERHGVVELEDPLILLHRQPIEDLAPLLRVLEMIATSKRSLLVMAEDVTGAALTTLIVNKRDAGLKVAAVKTPGLGAWRAPMIEDIAIATGGTVISPENGTALASLRPGMLGRASRITVSRQSTVLLQGGGDAGAIAQRRAMIRREIAGERHLSYDREQHQRRLARLSGGVATIRVGGRTPSETQARQALAKRAIAAGRAARRGGVLPHMAAVALVHDRFEADGTQVAPLVRRMLQAATCASGAAAATNGGADGIAVMRRIGAQAGLAYNVITDAFVSGSEHLFVTPAPVLTEALANAVSTVGALLAVEVALGRTAA